MLGQSAAADVFLNDFQIAYATTTPSGIEGTVLNIQFDPTIPYAVGNHSFANASEMGITNFGVDTANPGANTEVTMTTTAPDLAGFWKINDAQLSITVNPDDSVDVTGFGIELETLNLANSVRTITMDPAFLNHLDEFDAVLRQDPNIGASVVATPVPEPSGLALLGLGGLFVMRRRR